MRGIQINNYVSNNISLNGKKINNNNPTNINQPHRPTPLVINHLFNNQDVQQNNKSPHILKAKINKDDISGRKKRTNTYLIVDTQKNIQNKRFKEKISSSMEHIKKRTISPFKHQSRESSEDQEQKGINISYKKYNKQNFNNKIQQSKSITVKRSKSTIIRNSTKRSTEMEYSSRQINRAQKDTKQKINQEQINLNNLNCNSIKKNSSKKLIKKQTQELINQKKKTNEKTKISKISANQIKPRKNYDKLISDLQLNKFQTQKKSARTTTTKSFLTSAKQSKPISARERKINKNLFNNDIKQRDEIDNFEQTNTNYNFKQLNVKKQKVQKDVQVSKAINQFEKVIKKLGSKKVLTQELKKFTKKLQQIASKNVSLHNSHQNSDEQINQKAFNKIKSINKKQSSNNNKSKQKHIINKQTITQMSNKKVSSKKLIKNKKQLQKLQDNNYNIKIKKSISKSKKKNTSKKTQQIIKQKDQPSPFNYQQSDQSKYIKSRDQLHQQERQQNYGQERQEQIQDQILNKQYKQDNNQNQYQYQNKQNEKDNKQQYNNNQQSQEQQQQNLDSNNRKYMQFLKNLYQGKNSQNQQQQYIDNYLHQHKDKNQNDNSIDDINKYLNNNIDEQYQSQKPYQQQFNQKIFHNPLLQRKRNQNINVNLNNFLTFKQSEQPKNDNQQQEQHQKYKMLEQIKKLKQFQKQSDKMMEKISQKQEKKNNLEDNKKKLTIQIGQLNVQDGKNQQKITQNFSKNDTQQGHKNPTIKSSLSPKYHEHYPILIKSPKFSQIEIMNILAVKQRCLSSKHEKMNELINKMYERNLVSPKSYQYSIYQLKRKYQQQTNSIDNFKQQASQILHQINKDKQQIKDIDELIREQRWQQARKLMKNKESQIYSNQKGFRKDKEKIFNHNLEKNKFQTNYEGEQEGWEKVIINKKQQKQYKQPNLDDKKIINKQQNINLSPSKRPQNICVVQNNINISISPTLQQKKHLKKNNNNNNNNNSKKQKIHQHISSQQSELSQNNFQDLAKKLDYQLDQKYQIKQNINEQSIKRIFHEQDQFLKLQYNKQQKINQKNKIKQQQLQQEEEFENYIYYNSEQMQNSSGLSEIKANNDRRVGQDGIIKLIQVQNDQNQGLNINDQAKQVIKIYDQDSNNISSDLSLKQHSIQQQNNQHKKQPHQTLHLQQNLQSLQNNSQDCLTDSLLQLQLRKGFESNLFFIKQYCISLCQFIRDNQINKLEFKNNISMPIVYDIEQLLKNYRKMLNGEYNNQYNSMANDLMYVKEFRKPYKKAISEEIFDQFNKSYTQLKFYNLDLNKKGRAKFKFQKQAEKIFLTGMLDVLNQSLDFERPGSIFGKPLPWASSQKYLKNMKYLNGDKKKKEPSDGQESAETYDFIFGVAIARIIQWGSCLCGFLPDTAQLQNTQIDQDYVTHIRQTRMAFLLQKMLAQQQATINNSQLEQAQVIFRLGKIIMDQIIIEATQQLKIIHTNENLLIQADNNNKF